MENEVLKKGKRWEILDSYTYILHLPTALLEHVLKYYIHLKFQQRVLEIYCTFQFPFRTILSL